MLRVHRDVRLFILLQFYKCVLHPYLSVTHSVYVDDGGDNHVRHRDEQYISLSEILLSLNYCYINCMGNNTVIINVVVIIIK